jgi:hypothetical protein
LVEVAPPQEPNEIDDTDLRLAFYDNRLLQSYQWQLDTIFGEPRYFDIEQNLRHFAAL